MQDAEQQAVAVTVAVTETESPKPHGPRPERKPKHFQRRKPNHASAGSMQDIDEPAEPVEAEPVNVVPLDPSKPAASRHGQPWTAVERTQVSNAFREGLPIEQIAIACGRSNFAVACHLDYAGLLARVEAFKYAKATV